MKDISRNLTMLVDYYELTMANGYFQSGMKDKIAYFDVFYRENPENGGFAIAAGLEQVVDYINRLHFDEDDIAFLRGKNCFGENFLEYLRTFRFTGDIWAVPEGTVVFPGGAVADRPRARNGGTVYRNLYPDGAESRIVDCHQSRAHHQSRQRAGDQ